jgi:hypothetical protein
MRKAELAALAAIAGMQRRIAATQPFLSSLFLYKSHQALHKRAAITCA